MTTQPYQMAPGGASACWQGVNLISKSESTSPNPKKREQWKRKIDFLFACVGFSVGLGNVWRFPYLCYRNGGGAFLIPYLVAVVVGGIPMFTLEVMLGQFMSEGGIQPWKIAPLLQGIGYATTIIVFLLNCEYNVILTWTLYYLFSSFSAVLPWSHCNNAWNTVSCTTFEDLVSTVNVSQTNHTMVAMVTIVMNASNLDLPASLSAKANVSDARMDPVTEFWERKVLALSSGVGEPGAIKWDLALCLLLAWIIVYFCIWKGVKSSGKVMYFTASSPYIFMIVLLIRGVTLNGASLGIRYYLLPDWHRLQDPQVWVDAGTQIFFSYSIALGTLTALGSYNDFHHNCYRDSIFFAVINTFTSFLAGFVIFSILGSMAYRQNVDVSQVAESGPGLAFIAYPEAVSHLPVAPLWSSFFFIMIFLLGIDSQFVGVEGFITAIVDLYPHILRRGYRKELFIAAVCIACYLVGLSMVTQGGVYVFQLFDYYSASRIVIVVGFFECITLAYVYGVNRFYDNVQMMLGFRLNLWMKLCWSAFTPLYTMVIFVIGCISYSEVTYKRKSLLYIYPQWAICVGWLLAAVSAIFIPIVLVYKILITPGTLLQRVQYQIMPRLRRYQLRPNDDLNKVVLVEEFIHNAPCHVESMNGVGESLLLAHAK